MLAEVRMTSFGRGRGWASAQNKESVLRRPGTASPQTFDCTNMLNDINQVELDEQPQLSPDTKASFEAMTVDSQKNILNQLYANALNDRKFGQKFMKIFIHNDFQRNDDFTAKKYLLRKLQQSCDSRLELREDNLLQFRNVAYLLFEVYSFFKARYSRVVVSMELALIEFIDVLLASGNLEDLEILTEQLPKYGQPLYESEKSALDRSMLNVRKSLIAGNFSVQCRTMLLYLLDLHTCEYGTLSKELQDFYTRELGDTVLLTENSPEDTERTESHAVPRAIRGSGATRNQNQKSHTQKKPRATASTPKRPNEKKGWAHDDRLEKNYE